MKGTERLRLRIVLLAGVAMGCGQSTGKARLPTAPVSTTHAFEAVTTEAASAKPEPPVAKEPVIGERTFEALRALESGVGETVRITWLGDSHTAADFWTGEVRRRLQTRFGKGGPGFVSLALGGRRHEIASYKVRGTWKQEPKAGASRSRQLDGQFGLSGRRLHGFPGASLEVKSGISEASRWALLYRVHPTESSAPALELRSSLGEVLTPIEGHEGSFGVLSLEQPAGAGPVEINVKRGQFLLWGVVAETTRPGLVLDALGINGARLRTVFAWDLQAWHEQLVWRAPHLVVLSYGTNETGDGGDMARYADAYAEIIDLVHSADADCMLVGPTDRQDEAGHSMSEVEALDAHQRSWAMEHGCLYYSPFTAMGGAGGYGRWRKRKPQLAATDGVHLTISGYRFLADDWVRQFLDAYDAYVGSHP